MPFMVVRLINYATHKEEGLSAGILWCRISEAGLDVVFNCFPQAVPSAILLSWIPWLRENDISTEGQSAPFSTRNPPSQTAGRSKGD
jgi:hypothetical protein